MEPVIIDFGFC